MAVGLRLFTDRVGDGAGASVIDSDNGEELIYVQAGVSIVLANRPPESPGTLYISTKQVVWLSDLDRVKGYAVDFSLVSLHAVSRDPEAFPSPCIYIQIDTKGDDGDESWGLDSESNETLGLSNIKEMRLVPSDPNQLDTLFGIFCRCVELNPEPIEEEEEIHNWIFNADQMEDEVIDREDSEWPFFQNPTNSIGHSNGAHDLAHSVLEQLQINDECFEDAEEMEGDGNSSHR